MKNRHSSTTNLFMLLKDKDKLALRLTNRSFKNALKQEQQGPYKNKIEFTIAVTGTFHERKHHEIAWDLYSITVTSLSKNPAMLYKLRDLNDLIKSFVYDNFANNESMKATGRQYCPGENHLWDINRAWMLGQMHAGRSFVIFSELDTQSIMRRNYPNVFSAFAKEIGTAIKAGYTINITNDNRLQLNPPASTNQVTIDDIALTDTEMNASIALVNKAKSELTIARQCAADIKNLFSDIRNYTFEGLQQFKLVIEERITTTLDTMFQKCENKKLIMNSFINEFNKNLPYFSARIDTKKSVCFFVDKDNITSLRAHIINALTKQTEELIAFQARQEFKITLPSN